MFCNLLVKAKLFYQTVFFLVSLIINYCYDLQRFFRFSASINPYRTQVTHQGRIIAHYHVIEKGLSLKDPKPAFGTQIVNNLIVILTDYCEQYGLDDVSQVALNVLIAYYEFNLEKYGINNQELYKKITEIKILSKVEISNNEDKQGGVIFLKKDVINKFASISFKDFVDCRYSIRNFCDTDVDIRLIKEAVSYAIKTPSVCNRQTWQVYLYKDKDSKSKILSYQNGNRGFIESINKLLIITSDLSYFITAAERNQCFIEGGLFSMSLIYALHSLGLGSCCLNWSVTYQNDKLVRKVAGIKNSETIIMMLAVGHLPEKLFVANSPRKNTEDILTIKD
jgi:nitroreductase